MVDVVCENGKVDSVIIASKSGLYAVSAKTYVDCILPRTMQTVKTTVSLIVA